MILWLASYPRSGNTFFRAVLKHVYDIPTETIYDLDQMEMATWQRMKKVVDFQPENTTPLAELIASKQVHIVKTHDMPKEDHPAVYLVRDGRDALVSHAHYVLQYDWKLPAEERPARFYEALRMLVETDVSFGGWSGNVLAWLARTTPTAVLKFEDLIRYPLECVEQALNEVDYHPPQRHADRPPTFEELREAEPQFFRKGRVGAWRDEMPNDLHDLFWQRHAEAMDRMGYSRD
ncbi:MAG: sulfotransferase domain-containing protein [Anaerolineae bacterium]|nr:sulfotransferase domain-containing protein [Anaerolineae bacterium]